MIDLESDMSNTILHKTYLPFSEEIFKKHFVPSRKDSDNIRKHICKYAKSIENYKSFESKTKSETKINLIRQIEKDETFWTASSLMTIFHSENRDSELKQILALAFGEKPPLEDINSWDECLKGELHLYFEPNIPSSQEYLKWLKNHVTDRHLIPYIFEQAKNKKNEFRSDLEGPTNVDALLINSSNGFAVFIEAKVLSDISYQIKFDSMRNQIIRNIDVMLSSNKKSSEVLNKRNENKSLFLLLTPKMFKDTPRARLYGYIYNDYKQNPKLIGEDLVHRNLSLEDSVKIGKRMGWCTWEDLNNINNDCCKWLNS